MRGFRVQKGKGRSVIKKRKKENMGKDKTFSEFFYLIFILLSQ